MDRAGHTVVLEHFLSRNVCTVGAKFPSQRRFNQRHEAGDTFRLVARYLHATVGALHQCAAAPCASLPSSGFPFLSHLTALLLPRSGILRLNVALRYLSGRRSIGPRQIDDLAGSLAAPDTVREGLLFCERNHADRGAGLFLDRVFTCGI